MSSSLYFKKRRSSRVTKRQKYMEDAEMSDEDRHIDTDIAVTDALAIAVAVEVCV